MSPRHGQRARRISLRDTLRIMQRNEFDTGNSGSSRSRADSLGMEINCTAVISVGFITRTFTARPNLSEKP